MVTRRTKSSPSDREMQVMSVLWRLGEATVAEVQQALNEDWEPEIAYNTVLTHLRSLHAKRWVRSAVEGRAYRFHAAVSRDHARFVAVMELTEVLYDGSTELLLTELVSDRRVSNNVLGRVKSVLDVRLKGMAS